MILLCWDIEGYKEKVYYPIPLKPRLLLHHSAHCWYRWIFVAQAEYRYCAISFGDIAQYCRILGSVAQVYCFLRKSCGSILIPPFLAFIFITFACYHSLKSLKSKVSCFLFSNLLHWSVKSHLVLFPFPNVFGLFLNLVADCPHVVQFNKGQRRNVPIKMS